MSGPRGPHVVLYVGPPPAQDVARDWQAQSQALGTKAGSGEGPEGATSDECYDMALQVLLGPGLSSFSSPASATHPTAISWRKVPFIPTLAITTTPTTVATATDTINYPQTESRHIYSCSPQPSDERASDDNQKRQLATSCVDDSLYYQHSLAVHESQHQPPLLSPQHLRLMLLLDESTTTIDDLDDNDEDTQPDSTNALSHKPSHVANVSSPSPPATVATTMSKAAPPLSSERFQVMALGSIPSSAALAGIPGSTATVNLIAGVISIAAAHEVRTRWGVREVIELVVGDETRAGFVITFWLGTRSSAAYRASLTALRRQDVVLFRNIALTTFRDSVHGNSLRNGRTTAHLLFRGPAYRALDSRRTRTSNSALMFPPGHPHYEKTRRVREWVLNFVGAGACGAVRMGAKRLRKQGLLDWGQLPLDSHWVMLRSDGEFEPLPHEATLLKASGRISLEITKTIPKISNQSFPTKCSDGKLYLTNQRVIYLASNPSPLFTSFATPILRVEESNVASPIFGAWYWRATIRPIPDGGFPSTCGLVEVKLSFLDGGGSRFYQQFVAIKERLHHAQDIGAPLVTHAHLDELPSYDAPVGHVVNPDSHPPLANTLASNGSEQQQPPPSLPLSTSGIPNEPPPAYES